MRSADAVHRTTRATLGRFIERRVLSWVGARTNGQQYQSVRPSPPPALVELVGLYNHPTALRLYERGFLKWEDGRLESYPRERLGTTGGTPPPATLAASPPKPAKPAGFLALLTGMGIAFRVPWKLTSH